jgi:RNA polymerase sigma factor (TIGR02999 family)
MAAADNITQLLLQWSKGDKQALNELMPLLYGELRRLAEARLRQERPDHTLQATALIHEAYMRLADWQAMEWQNRAHFLAVAAQLMRNILVDHARKHIAAKRGGERYKLSLSDIPNLAKTKDPDLIALDDALTTLAAIDPQQSRIVEMRYFGGLSIDEIAAVLAISPSTVSREWKLAKVWLLHELDNSAEKS